MFHLFQAAARGEGRAISAKGLTGTGYDGHAFWDTESFVLPILTFTAPETVRDALEWRHSILARRARARTAAAPQGRGDAVAHDPRRGVLGLLAGRHRGLPRQRRRGRRRSAATWRSPATASSRSASGCELLVESARLWASLGYHSEHGDFRIDGVTGPDEYSALVDNNVYTNLMAQLNLRAAADAGRPLPGDRRAARRRRGRGRGLAARGRADARALRRGARHPPPGLALPRARALGLREHAARGLPAAAALPLPAPLQQAGGQAGGPGARDALARRRLHRRAEATQLRLLRAAVRARLVAVGLHAGRGRRRGRAPRPRARLPLRGRPDGHRRPRAEHRPTGCTWPRWPAR